MADIKICLLLLTWNACMMENSICLGEGSNIYDPCSYQGDFHPNTGLQDIGKRGPNPRKVYGMQSIVQGTEILVLETMNFVSRLQRMHVDNTCLNPGARVNNIFARIRNCVVHGRIMAFNLSLFNDEYNITEWFDGVYVDEVTGQASVAVVLAYILNLSENEYTYKQFYRRVMDNIFDILCAVSDFWTGDEPEILDDVSSFSRNVLKRLSNPIDPVDSLLLLRVIESRLQSIYETSLAVEFA